MVVFNQALKATATLRETGVSEPFSAKTDENVIGSRNLIGKQIGQNTNRKDTVIPATQKAKNSQIDND